MAVSALFPNIWSARITYYATVFSAFMPNATRQWEGEAIYGNTIKVPTVDRSVTIRDYSRTTDLAMPEDIDATTQDLPIDQEKYFNFALEDLDARQSRIPGASLIDLKSQGAGIAIANVIDSYVASRLNTAAQANFLLNAAARAFNGNFITEIKQAATIAGLPHAGLVMVSTPEVVKAIEDGIINGTYGDALASQTFGRAVSADPALQNGFAMLIGGIPLFVSNSTVLRRTSAGGAITTGRGGRSVLWAYNPLDLALVMQVNQTETYRAERRFSSGVKGLVNYGSKILDEGRLIRCIFND